MPQRPVLAPEHSAPAPLQIPNHFYPQTWLLVFTLALLGIYIAWDLNFLETVFALDQSYITSLIAALLILCSGHAAWYIFGFSRRIEQTRRWLLSPDPSAHRDDEFIRQFIHELDYDPALAAGNSDQSQSSSVVEIFADRLRSPVELGWFLVDLAVRLGLVGTIIGFILIFTSLSDSSNAGSDGLKTLLLSMSGGMGTALFTTLCGLVAATILALQYLILGREVEMLVAQLIRIRNRCARNPGN